MHADEWTLPEVTKAKGYATACIGKWHLGDQPPHLPTAHGFDGANRHFVLERHGQRAGDRRYHWFRTRR